MLPRRNSRDRVHRITLRRPGMMKTRREPIFNAYSNAPARNHHASGGSSIITSSGRRLTLNPKKRAASGDVTSPQTNIAALRKRHGYWNDPLLKKRQVSQNTNYQNYNVRQPINTISGTRRFGVPSSYMSWMGHSSQATAVARVKPYSLLRANARNIIQRKRTVSRPNSVSKPIVQRKRTVSRPKPVSKPIRKSKLNSSSSGKVRTKYGPTTSKSLDDELDDYQRVRSSKTKSKDKELKKLEEEESKKSTEKLNAMEKGVEEKISNTATLDDELDDYQRVRSSKTKSKDKELKKLEEEESKKSAEELNAMEKGVEEKISNTATEAKKDEFDDVIITEAEKDESQDDIATEADIEESYDLTILDDDDISGIGVLQMI